MGIYFKNLFFCVLFTAIVNGATISTTEPINDLEAGNQQRTARFSSSVAAPTPVPAGLADHATALFSADYLRNVGDLIDSRWFFRKATNYSEAIGNTVLYIGSGAASVAAGVKLIGSSELSDIFLFTSTACFAFHITLIGIAKCSAAAEGVRETQLGDLAAEVGFSVVPLEHVVTDDGTSSAVSTIPVTNSTSSVLPGAVIPVVNTEV